jgi:pimeloyl-ACP methyl ester carboxylesterase
VRLTAPAEAGLVQNAQPEPVATAEAGGVPRSVSQGARLPTRRLARRVGACAARLGEVDAVVSRGGRLDLAAPRLAEVRAPGRLIVGGHDEVAIELDRQAQRAMHTQCELSIVPGATHLFEEPGALEKVSRLASNWFESCLAPAGPAARQARPGATPCSRSAAADPCAR